MNSKHTFAILRSLLLVASMLTAFPAPGAPPPAVPFRVAPVLPDVAEMLPPGDVTLLGWLGERVMDSEKNRLTTADLRPFLAGFKQKPGTHPWIGEHIGKWMHAATLAWAYTGDPWLRRQLDYAAGELIAAQEPDGYLGTYIPEERFGLYQRADWDVWSHKYCLLGLLTYYQYTGNKAALESSRKAADLLVRTFGPGRKSILAAGTHLGMASTSVLEPIVLLYRFTGDPRYLQFAQYIVKSWNEPGGPRILDTLLTVKQVNKTANGKAYEMLSNLVGLCELARVTGDRELLTAVLNAWADITERRLYLTGTASQGEFFKDDYYLPNGIDAHLGEACVTVTWIQLNSQLLRLTGEARFGNELERSFYNSLTAAQHPNGDWCYFTPLEGTKFYDPAIKCCHSSGPRGIALIPQQAYFVLRGQGTAPDTIAVNLFEKSRAKVEVKGGPVEIEQQADFPRSPEITLSVKNRKGASFSIAVRAPAWAMPARACVTTTAATAAEPRMQDGWLVFPACTWENEDRIRITLKLLGQLIAGTHGNQGKAALTYGPFVLAYDDKTETAAPAVTDVQVETPSGVPVLCPGSGKDPLEFHANVHLAGKAGTSVATFVPFADAGLTGGRYQVWLPLAQPAKQ